MTENTELEALRQRYELAGIDDPDLTGDPIEMFTQWFAVANEHAPGKWFEPNAMTLSTTDGAGDVGARIVLLKKIDRRGFYFFTNYSSDKGQHLSSCSKAALTLHWPYLGRQVRIVGHVTKTEQSISEEYFHSRPRASQISAVASAQSTVIASRSELESRFAEIDQQYVNSEIPLPDFWGGYLVSPESIEFWQGRENRMHDRFRYERNGEGWTFIRLAP